MATAQPPVESPPAGEISAPVGESDSSGAPASAPEPESAVLEPAVDREPQTLPEVPETATRQTDSVGQVPSDSGDRKPAWTPRTRRDQPPLARTPSEPIPEPVSSPVVTPPKEPRASLQGEPATVEAVEEVDRSASPPQETEAGQAVADRQPPAPQKPAYQGPKRGVVVWTGEVAKGTTVVIEGASASIGQVQGALPGVACMVRLSAPNVAVTEGPGPRNGYRRISLRFNKKGRFSVPVEWEVLH